MAKYKPKYSNFKRFIAIAKWCKNLFCSVLRDYWLNYWYNCAMEIESIRRKTARTFNKGKV